MILITPKNRDKFNTFSNIKVKDKIYYKVSERDKFSFYVGEVVNVSQGEDGLKVECKVVETNSLGTQYTLNTFVVYPETVSSEGIEVLYKDNTSLVMHILKDIFVYSLSKKQAEELFDKYKK